MRNFLAMLVLLGLVATSCTKSGALPVAGTWRAWKANGDKPGVGIEVTRNGDKLGGFMYILNPAKPGDFGGDVLKTPMDVEKSTERGVKFKFKFDAAMTEPEEAILRFDGPLEVSPIHATLQRADGKNDPVSFDFVRVP